MLPGAEGGEGYTAEGSNAGVRCLDLALRAPGASPGKASTCSGLGKPNQSAGQSSLGCLQWRVLACREVLLQQEEPPGSSAFPSCQKSRRKVGLSVAVWAL